MIKIFVAVKSFFGKFIYHDCEPLEVFIELEARIILASKMN